MSISKTKFFVLFLIIFSLFSFLYVQKINAQGTHTPFIAQNTIYKPLAPLPGLDKQIDTKRSDANPCPLGNYLNIIIKLFFGICGVLAVVMITMGGVQYMTSELVSSKEAGRESITHAVIGLLLALAAYLILNTINPDLLNACLNNMDDVKTSINEPAEVLNVGFGATVGGKTVSIKNGTAAPCAGGLVTIPSGMGSGQICKDLLDRLLILKSKNSTWKITSIFPQSISNSSCHKEGAVDSGNCADLQITPSTTAQEGYTKDGGATNAAWGDFCYAVADAGNLTFLNEASKIQTCNDLIAYKAYNQTTGPHLHVIYLGGGASAGNGTSTVTQGAEVYKSATFDSSGSITIGLEIQNYDPTIAHKAEILAYSTVWTDGNPSSKSKDYINITGGNNIVGNTGARTQIVTSGTSAVLYLFISNTEYEKLKNKSVSVLFWSKGVGIGKKTVSVK